jgi:glutamate N-acetyltransferase/amino-acid N-acetyltransferase
VTPCRGRQARTPSGHGPSFLNVDQALSAFLDQRPRPFIHAVSEALADLCLDLTQQLASDGEGATKLLRVTVGQAGDYEQAKRIAKSVVNSPLVKTAVHGADPDWGRVLMAIGKNTDDTGIAPDNVTLSFGDIEVYPEEPKADTLDRLVGIMRQDEVDIIITLGLGEAETTVHGCDLSAGYIRINADYTT